MGIDFPSLKKNKKTKESGYLCSERHEYPFTYVTTRRYGKKSYPSINLIKAMIQRNKQNTPIQSQVKDSGNPLSKIRN